MVLLFTQQPISRLGRMFMARLTGGLWHIWGSGFGRLLSQRGESAPRNRRR
jgi:hypothetical protein